MVQTACLSKPTYKFKMLTPKRRNFVVRAEVKEISGVIVDSNPSEEKLKKMGVSNWPTWGSEVDKFPWSYSDKETCYLLEGDVTVTPDGGEPVDIKAGDMAVFPKGMSCTWDVKKPIRKHYKFGETNE
eukprot:TRINITY_DN11091_c0_g1_i8.p2 TRINITY_DN11091_c0_g1~~TRINITY_DN11091_c0_g1_i8.p2  ORF type:complete len:145 (+),score=22.01 TRINITY_DN11091_c0_g1_i8:53-436(+)